jgi:hypothetical protein
MSRRGESLTVTVAIITLWGVVRANWPPDPMPDLVAAEKAEPTVGKVEIATRIIETSAKWPARLQLPLVPPATSATPLAIRAGRSGDARMTPTPPAQPMILISQPDRQAPLLLTRIAPPANPPAQTSSSPRIQLSAWVLMRGGSAPAGAFTDQLGGSQAGIRVRTDLLRLDRQVSFGPTLRLSAALQSNAEREIAPGVSLRLNRAIPIEIIAERRIDLSGRSSDRWAALVATGVNDVPLARTFRLNGYAQAGLVGGGARSGFAGGSITITRPVGATSASRASAGIGSWAEAQRGSVRLDIGPVVTARIEPVGTPVSLSAQWRFRVAGRAAPASGPALVIATDF